MLIQHQMKWKCSLERKLDLWSFDEKEWRIKSHEASHTLHACTMRKMRTNLAFSKHSRPSFKLCLN